MTNTATTPLRSALLATEPRVRPGLAVLLSQPAAPHSKEAITRHHVTVRTTRLEPYPHPTFLVAQEYYGRSGLSFRIRNWRGRVVDGDIAPNPHLIDRIQRATAAVRRSSLTSIFRRLTCR